MALGATQGSSVLGATIHAHSHTDGISISILLKDTLKCGLEEPGIGLANDLLYLLSDTCRMYLILN